MEKIILSRELEGELSMCMRVCVSNFTCGASAASVTCSNKVRFRKHCLFESGYIQTWEMVPVKCDGPSVSGSRLKALCCLHLGAVEWDERPDEELAVGGHVSVRPRVFNDWEIWTNRSTVIVVATSYEGTETSMATSLDEASVSERPSTTLEDLEGALEERSVICRRH